MELPFLPDREFFSMGEMSRIAQVAPHTLRYWEKHFGDLRPVRGRGGHRRYSRAHIELVILIRDLLHQRKMTVQGARRALIEHRRGPTPSVTTTANAAPSGATLKLLREVQKELKMLVDEL